MCVKMLTHIRIGYGTDRYKNFLRVQSLFMLCLLKVAATTPCPGSDELFSSSNDVGFASLSSS